METTKNSHLHVGVKISSQIFVINPSLKVIFCGEDQILVIHGIRSEFKQIIRDEGNSRLLGRIMRRMTASPTSLEDLINEGYLAQDEVEDAVNLVQVFSQRGILTNVNTTPVDSYINSILGLGSSLNSICIGIVGAGQLGISIAEELALINVGRMRVIDDRCTGFSEYEQKYLGLSCQDADKDIPYVDLLKSRLQDRGYDRVEGASISYDAPGVLEELLTDVNFLIVSSEVFSSHLFHTADIATISASKPWISAFIDGSEGCIGPIYIPGETCCYNEFEIQMESTLPTSAGEYFLYKEAISDSSIISPQFVFPPYLSIVAGFVANVVSSFLLSGRSYLVGRCLRINFEKPYIDYEEILKLPRTPTSVSSRHGYRNTFL